ncbi:MAG: UTP--glucose-1-phosphate uridylyltransferase [Planctomycetes bacterium]|nr:UTP--glucose-1-phosphate uridylyltransferase [Planctomycetota bacterium]
MKEIINAIVPVAGLGTRLLPATKSQPKEMLPVGKKPIVQYVVEELVRNGIQRLLFVTGKGKDSIENHFDPDEALVRMLRENGKEDLLAELPLSLGNVNFFYTRQSHARGLGDAIRYGEHFAGDDPFVVALGDSIIGLHADSTVIGRMAECFRANRASAVVALLEVPEASISRYGIAKPAGGGEVFRLDDLVEKPSVAESPSNLAVAARYIFSPAIFGAIEETRPGKGGEVQITDAIRILIGRGEPVYGVKLRPQERRFDIGNFESYFETFLMFALSDPQYGAGLRTTLRRWLDANHSD